MITVNQSNDFNHVSTITRVCSHPEIQEQIRTN